MKGNFENGRAAAHSYLDLGFDPLPILPRSKEPRGKWGEKYVVSHTIIDHAFQGGDNVAVALGARSDGLVDFDFDHPVAVEMAELLEGVGLLPSGPVFGRKSNRASHRLFRCADAGRLVVCQVPDDLKRLINAPKSKLIEVRGNGCYTVMPGSIHPSGEPVVWEPNSSDDLPELSGAEAVRLGGLIGFLTVIDQCPPPEGARNDAALALTGTLMIAGVEPQIAEEIVVALAERANDEEATTRRFGDRTARFLEAGKPVVAVAKLCGILGLDAHKRLFRSWLHPTTDSNKAAIHIVPGKLAEAVDKAEAALLEAGLHIYERSGELVRPCRLDAQRSMATASNLIQVHDPEPSAGALVLTPVTEPWLLDQLSRVARFAKPSARKGDSFVTADPPLALARGLLARKGAWRLPVIRGLIEAPTLRRDRSILQDEGHDPQSGLYFDAAGIVFPKIPEEPSREDALRALERFIRLFRCFPFAPHDAPEDWRPDAEEGLKPSVSRSVVLSAVLTGLVRRSLASAPLHAVDAPTRGSGKSLIADLVSIIVTGRRARVVSWVRDEAENEKRLFSALLQGDPAIFIDNVEHQLESAALCSILTQGDWTSRVLKESKNVSVSTAALFMATGNNLAFKGDMTRRVVVARLDPRAERPEERGFSFDAREHAVMERSFLVASGLTILRAYVAAGCPMRGRVSPVGSFEDWTFIREALTWLDQPDPALSRSRVQDEDPEREELGEVMAAWAEAFGDRPVTVREALDFAFEGRNGLMREAEEARPRLRLLAAFEQTGFGDKVNAKRLGHWFKSRSGKIVDAKSFEKVGTDGHKSSRYVLRGAQPLPKKF
ncbi:MAG: bifunctional DNA primase/polymerase [Hydrogenophilaceae bacterium]|jgi:hypothetical protein|nr:bifunctional DNA primase/polymerase [Hydrogenophilaceae bacterium]